MDGFEIFYGCNEIPTLLNLTYRQSIREVLFARNTTRLPEARYQKVREICGKLYGGLIRAAELIVSCDLNEHE